MAGKRMPLVLAVIGGLSLIWASLASAGDYTHEVKAQKMAFAWKINDDNLEVKLSAETTGWVAIGFHPTEGMKNGKVTLCDDFGDNPAGHKADDKLGGTE